MSGIDENRDKGSKTAQMKSLLSTMHTEGDGRRTC
jgi:hypothetical protein